MPDQEKCKKCGKPLDTENPEKWCKACRAAYMREYNATKEGRAEAKGFAKGREAMRVLAVEEFVRLGSTAHFNAIEVADLLHGMPGPQYDAEPTAAAN